MLSTTTVSVGSVGGPGTSAPMPAPVPTVPATNPNRPVADPAVAPTATTTVSGSSTSVPPRTSTTRPGPPTQIVDALPAADERCRDRLTVPLLIAVALVVVLVGLAVSTKWRRRWQE